MWMDKKITGPIDQAAHWLSDRVTEAKAGEIMCVLE
jgi:hypothetical protein